VNGIMFIVGGIMISRPGVRIGSGIEAGIESKSLELVQYAARPVDSGDCCRADDSSRYARNLSQVDEPG